MYTPLTDTSLSFLIKQVILSAAIAVGELYLSFAGPVPMAKVGSLAQLVATNPSVRCMEQSYLWLQICGSLGAWVLPRKLTL